MKVRNKPLFWTGLAFIIVQMAGIALFGLSFLSYDWLTKKVLVLILGISGAILYIGLSFILIYFGLKDDKPKKKK